MFQDEIEMLVAETFKEAGRFSARLPDEVPGLLYHLQKNASTFVIRILATENLSEERERILRAPEDYPSLRLLSGDDERPLGEKLKFFECDNSQMAKAIKAQLANKRFPLHEERIINVSDPGDNWWIKKEENSFSLYFKLCRTESMGSIVKAGPLGDCDDAMSFFNKLYGYFSLLFPVEDFSSAHGQFSISSSQTGNVLFEEVANVFIKGEIGNALWEKLRSLEAQAFEQGNPEVLTSIKRANYFLMEIAALRSFWIEIQNDLV